MTKITKRENEVCNYLRKGFTNKDIGDKLGVTEITVKMHVYNLARKMVPGKILNRTQIALILNGVDIWN